MQAELVIDADANPAAAPVAMRSKIAFVQRNGKDEPYFPKGTVFEGPQALFLVQTGQAKPIDDECKKACGMTEDELAANSVEYEMDAKGIRGVRDRNFYITGVIIGYDGEGKYIPGPNWNSWHAEKKEREMEDDI